MLNIICIDGASASIRNSVHRECRDYMSDVVHDIMREMAKTKTLSTVYRSERGGIARRKKRLIKEYIRDFNVAEHSLLILGKSTGAKAIVDVLNKLCPLKYKKVGLLIVDGDWIWRRLRLSIFKKDTLLKVPKIDFCQNIYQLNQNLGGAKVFPFTYNNYQVRNRDVNHWNIVNYVVTKDTIKWMIGELHD